MSERASLSSQTAIRDSSVLRRVNHLGSARSGMADWRLQRLTVLALIPLGLYFVASILTLATSPHATPGIWLAQPVTALLMLLFVGSMFVHAVLGLRSIFAAYIHTHGLKLGTGGCHGMLLARHRSATRTFRRLQPKRNPLATCCTSGSLSRTIDPGFPAASGTNSLLRYFRRRKGRGQPADRLVSDRPAIPQLRSANCRATVSRSFGRTLDRTGTPVRMTLAVLAGRGVLDSATPVRSRLCWPTSHRPMDANETTASGPGQTLATLPVNGHEP